MKGKMSQACYGMSMSPTIPVFTGMRASINSIFSRIYEYLLKRHPHLFMVFLIVGIPIGSIIILAGIMIVITSPLILIYGW